MCYSQNVDLFFKQPVFATAEDMISMDKKTTPESKVSFSQFEF